MPPSAMLHPGLPDDENREYLPDRLRTSNIVVNENGNNSQPYPERLEEHRQRLFGDADSIWYSYVPTSYDPSNPVPLVVSLHGGLMTGWGQAVYTSWTAVAEREGFIVVFPNSSSPRRMWVLEIAEEFLEAATAPHPSGVFLDPPPESIDENPDIKLLLAVIERVKGTHSIDAERIFIQGMSMGNAMSDQFARHFGYKLAGVAGSGGPSALGVIYDPAGKPVNSGGPVPMFMTILEIDTAPPFNGGTDREVITGNRDYWRAINGANALPSITVRGRNNFAIYSGADADVVFRDVQNRDHGQTFDDAELVWSHFFSGSRRKESGRIERTLPAEPLRGDAFAVAVASGRDMAWTSDGVIPVGGTVFTRQVLKYHGLNGDARVRGEYLFVPLDFVSAAFTATASVSADGTTGSLILADGRHLEFAQGSIGCVIDGRITTMFAEAVMSERQLWLSLEWLAAEVLDLRTSSAAGVLYITDHHAVLSTNMAHLIDDILATAAPR